MSAFQPSQSSSARPSSIDTSGYFDRHAVYFAIMPALSSFAFSRASV